MKIHFSVNHFANPQKTGYNTTYIAYFVKNKIRQHSQTVVVHSKDSLIAISIPLFSISRDYPPKQQILLGLLFAN